MTFPRAKRQVPKPDLVGPHQSVNPMFSSSGEWSDFRRRVLLLTLVGLALTAVGFAIFGPWLAIENITITGTRLLNNISIQQTTSRYLDGRRWVFLPNRSLVVLSTRGLSKYLDRQIRQRLSIESVTVTKNKPHGLTIVVVERTPVANWITGSTIGTVDTQGKIIELPISRDLDLPILHDESEKIFSIDSSVVKVDVMSSFIVLVDNFRRANIEVKEFIIPFPVCPTPIVQTPDPATAAENTASVNTNRSIQPKTPTPVLNVNLDSNALPPCDRESLRYSSQEIHVQLLDGPRVYFDRHSNLPQAVQALKRVLTEQSNKTYTSIDVRFDDRVYVQ